MLLPQQGEKKKVVIVYFAGSHHNDSYVWFLYERQGCSKAVRRSYTSRPKEGRHTSTPTHQPSASSQRITSLINRVNAECYFLMVGVEGGSEARLSVSLNVQLVFICQSGVTSCPRRQALFSRCSSPFSKKANYL